MTVIVADNGLLDTVVTATAKAVKSLAAKPTKAEREAMEATMRIQKVRQTVLEPCKVEKQAQALYERVEASLVKYANRVWIGESHVPLRPYPECVVERVIEMFDAKGVPCVHIYNDEGKRHDTLRFKVSKLKMKCV